MDTARTRAFNASPQAEAPSNERETWVLLSGNEAIARGAWEAGVVFASGYPGTPSTEILETFARFPGIYAEWAPNEKVALDAAIGAAYAGRRALATMKHVGLNVAADAFFYASMTGLEAGLVIAVADDPGMHSSQNEQDTRNYAKFARVPCLDPADSQDARDMVIAGLDLSEQFDTPVIVRPTTRISHGFSRVRVGMREEHPPRVRRFPRNPSKYVMVPSNARKRHPVVEERIRRIAEYAETFPLNRVEMRDGDLGIITTGIAYQYAREIFPHASILKLGMVWPLPHDLIADFARQVKRLIVLEELDPFIEEHVRMMGIPVEGKSIFPLIGEFNPHIVREAAIEAGLLPETARPPSVPLPDLPELPGRPPVLCPGCPHRGVFWAIKKLHLPVNGDIGCYTLGVVPPLNAIHTTGCMGAGIGVAHGASKAGSPEKHVAVIGDSTFFHTGIPALINVAYNRSPVIVVIMDNRVTAMTGDQPNPGTGETLMGEKTQEVDIEALVRAIGIKHVTTVDAYNEPEVERVLKAYKRLDEPAVLITRRPCALLPEVRKQYVPLKVNPDLCDGCGVCIQTGCPALVRSKAIHIPSGRQKVEIDPLLCTGCELCAQVCPQQAISFRDQVLGDKTR
ncbi:MAG: indolepyruvate ferredoxin oxidoreductase subunit alpha [Chloroflexi bacterium]|nr:indolepyruvate ferredoxin oxidoreductase subunit alpha [Chloroflexota bacterium]